MRRLASRSLLALAVLLTGACDGQSAGSDAGQEVREVTTQAHSDHAADAVATEHEALALRPIMQGLAANMATFTYALWLEDYEAMTASASALADHPHIAPDEIQRIEAELGPDMAAFEAADEAVHLASMRMLEAAEARRLDDVLASLADVQRGCLACHTEFRDRLRTDSAAVIGQ